MRLKKFTEEKAALRTEIDQLHQQLISAKTQRRSGSQNGPVDEDDFEDAQSKRLKLRRKKPCHSLNRLFLLIIYYSQGRRTK